MGGVREDLEAAGLDVRVVSAGSSITSAYLTAADGITRIRPGAYVYNDLRHRLARPYDRLEVQTAILPGRSLRQREPTALQWP